MIFTFKYSDPPAILINRGTAAQPDVVSYTSDDIEAYQAAFPERNASADFAALHAGAAPARTPEGARADKLAALAALRWEHETAGIQIGELRILTDRESQAQLTSAYTSLKNGFIESTDWKGANGWQSVTLADITPPAAAVAQHVAACFANERVHATAIAALPDDVAVIDAYDITAGWPGA